MTTIKNSIRKIVFGLLVAGLAVVGSAFSNKSNVVSLYSYMDETPDRWNNKDAWEPTPSQEACTGSLIPCEIDLDQTGHSSLESFLSSLSDYSEFEEHPAVSLKAN